MAEITFNKIFLISFILFVQLESFIFFCYNSIINMTKIIKIKKQTQTQTIFNNYYTNNTYLYIFLISIFFIKSSEAKLLSILFLLTIFIIKLSSFLERFFESNTIYMLLPSFIFFLTLLLFINSFLIFFFVIELYAVLYYFCFLTSYKFTNQTIIKYKNGLLFLLWNNFLTTVFLSLGCFFIGKSCGTTNFMELCLLNINETGVYFFLIGLFWKLGLPVFHFFKLEVYKYLLKENVFLFSILTTTINFILIFFLLTQSIVFSVVYLNNFLVIILLFAIVLTILNLKLVNILQFFALSGMLTLTTSLVVILI